MPGSEPVRHHLVSRGLQNNFADDEKLVTIIDAATGAVVKARQSTKSNFAEDHFNSVVTPAGLRDAQLEHRWAGIESSALELARAVSPANAHEDDTRAAVCEVFALHIVRSHAYLEAHRRIVEQVTEERTPGLVANPEARRLYIEQYGHEPTDDELAAAVASFAAEREGDNSWFVDSMVRVYDEIVTRFATRHVQVISTPPELPGFVLSDVPIVHADSRTRRYGFRDGLAIGDADLIVGPLTRRTAVCLTAEPMEHFAVTTKKATQLINAAFWRSARELVASHPDDTREARRVLAHLDDLPVAKLLG